MITFNDDLRDGWIDLDETLRIAGRAEWRLHTLHMRRGELDRQARMNSDDPRYPAAIRDIDTRIARSSVLFDNAAGTERRKTAAIEEGKAAEHEPEHPRVATTGLREDDSPPAAPRDRFEDRLRHKQKLEQLLNDLNVRLILLTGPAGIGKTGLLADLLATLHAGAGELRAHGFCYLPAYGFRPVNADAVVSSLVRMVPDARAHPLEAHLDNHVGWRDLLDEVLDELGDDLVVLAIDNVEHLLDRNGRLDGPDLREVIDHLIERPNHRVRPILISRRQVVGLAPPGAVVLSMTDGLPVENAARFLRSLDTDGLLRLDSVPDLQIGALHQATAGSPRALELAFGLLSGPYGMSVPNLVDALAAAPDAIAYLLTQTFERLDLTDRRIVQALAVYGRPVKPATVDHLLSPYLQGPGSAARLHTLHRRRLVRRDRDEHYFVPPSPDRELLITSIPAGRSEPTEGRTGRRPQFTRSELWDRAADYFRQSRPPDERITGMESLRSHFAEIDLLIEGGRNECALDLVEKINDTHLRGWGRSATVLRFLEKLSGALTGPDFRRAELRRACLVFDAYTQRDDHEQLVRYGAEVRRLARGLHDHSTEAAILIHLGNSHRDNGSPATAVRLFRKALRRLRPPWPDGSIRARRRARGSADRAFPARQLPPSAPPWRESPASPAPGGPTGRRPDHASGTGTTAPRPARRHRRGPHPPAQVRQGQRPVGIGRTDRREGRTHVRTRSVSPFGRGTAAQRAALR